MGGVAYPYSDSIRQPGLFVLDFANQFAAETLLIGKVW